MMIKQQEQVFVEENMSNLTSPVSGEASVSSSSNRGEPSSSIYPQQQQQQQYFSHQQQQDQSSLQEQSDQPPAKKKRNLPGNPDPDSEVIALSPKTLLATNRFLCEVCGKGFQRDQNLQLHRRGHNLPWKLKQRSKTEVIRKKVYVCPETSCVHHDPSRALGDLTGIKKHFCRKHGEKKWKCEKCSKRYAVQSDWKAHSKVCGTREYRCDCGTLFSRRDSFITHRAFCDALAEETARGITHPLLTNTISAVPSSTHFLNMQQQQQQQAIQLINSQQQQQQQHHHQDNPLHAFPLKREQHQHHQNLINLPPWLACPPMDTHHVNHHHQQQHHLASPSSSSSSIFHHQDQHQQLMQQQQQSPHHLTDHQQHHHQIQQHQVQHQQNQNPSNPSMGPTYTTSSSGGGGAGGLAGPYHTQAAAAPSAHTSATALLQQAAQMGASMSKTAQQNQGHVSDNNSNTTTATTSTAGLFGLNLSSRDHQQEIMSSSTTSTGLILNHGLSSFGNKAANPTTPPTTIPTTCGGPESGSGPDYATPGPGLGPSSSSSYLHDMMVNSLSSSPYDDDAFGMGGMGMLGTSTTTTTGVAGTTNKKDLAFHQAHGGRGRDEGGATANGGGNDGLTRDFLGLRPLSHNEILTMAGLGNCMTTSNSTTTSLHQQETHKPWQT